MKIDEIPDEGERIDLKELPQKIELLWMREEERPAAQGKTGGLIIWYKTRSGATVPQKYSKIAGGALKKALKQLGYTNTEQLGEYWHLYELTSLRTGFPRYIPVKRLEKAKK